jgi:hypothetical protein
MADQYLEYVHRCIIPVYQQATGNVALLVMKESRGELVYFLLLSFWDSDEALASFTKEHLDMMKPNTEEKGLLTAFESTAKSYKVICRRECSQVTENI